MSGLTLPTYGPVTQDFLGSRWGVERATLQPLTLMQLRPHPELSAAPVMGSFQIGGSVLLHFELEDFSPEAFALNEQEEENGTTKSGNDIDILSLVPSKRPNALLRLPTELNAMIFEQNQDQSPFSHGGHSVKRLLLNVKNVTHIEIENEHMSEDLWIGLDQRVLNPLDALAECDATSGLDRCVWPKLALIYAGIEPFGTPPWEHTRPCLNSDKAASYSSQNNSTTAEYRPYL